MTLVVIELHIGHCDRTVIIFKKSNNIEILDIQFNKYNIIKKFIKILLSRYLIKKLIILYK